MTEAKHTSPRYLRLSLAAAMTLGLRPGTFFRGAQLHCLNLLLTYAEGCHANCSYCGLSRFSRQENANSSFIRVEWPTYRLQEVIDRTMERRDILERVCISMVMHPRAFEDTVFLVKRLSRETGLPVSVLVNPSTMAEGYMEEFYEAGADMVSVAIDAATEELFEAHRGEGVIGPHKWDNYWRSFSEAALVFGRNRVGCHLIVGLGETEQQMARTIQRVREMGGRTHLFSFYPEDGSRLAAADPCPASQFRRVQLARFLIDYDMVNVNRMKFDEHGRIIEFGIKGGSLDELVDSGKPFMTSGCPGRSSMCACNRPYGDGPPGNIRSFPFELDKTDVQSIRKELATYREVAQVIDVEA